MSDETALVAVIHVSAVRSSSYALARSAAVNFASKITMPAQLQRYDLTRVQSKVWVLPFVRELMANIGYHSVTGAISHQGGLLRCIESTDICRWSLQVPRSWSAH